jgi:hypothetical protein
MSRWLMRGHFGHLHFKNFPLIQKTPQWKVFWPLQTSSKFLGVPEDSKSPLLGVWVSSSHLAQSGVATLEVEALKLYDPTISNLELTWKISLEWFHSPPIFMGGGNPFGSLLSSKNSKSKMEFGESRIKSNTLVWNKLLR